MSEKEFVLVSQGIEIYRTKSQENAVNMVKKENDEYFDYCQRCADNYERPADNYIDLEIEYPSEKEKDKEIERINNIIKVKDEGFKASTEDLCETAEELEKANNIINKMNDYLVMNIADGSLDFMYRQGFKDCYEKLIELKGSDKE